MCLIKSKPVAYILITLQYDSAMELIEGTMPLQNYIYPVTAPEIQTIEIEELLKLLKTYIHLTPTKSLHLSAFFIFVEKKGGGLRPCILTTKI